MGALKAKVDGAWVPLEYSGAANPQNALGVVAMGSLLDISTVQPGTTTITNPINFTSIVGRRYRLCYQIRVISVTTGNGIQLTWTGSGVEVSGTDTWQSVPTGPYSYFTGGLVFDGTGVASSYTMRAYVTGAAGVWLSPSTISYFYLEDIGPNAAPALPLPPTPQAWTPLTLTNGFTHRTTGYQPAVRKVGDVVECRGLMDCPTTSVSTVFTTLPSGFWPAKSVAFPVLTGAAPNTYVVRNTGTIETVLPNPNPQYAGLDVIKYSVTP